MLLKLSVNRLPLSGYVNVDPAPLVEADKISNFNLKPIDFRIMDVFDVAKDAECEEIIGENVLEYVKSSDVKKFLTYLSQKLRKNGKIYLSGFDNTEICRQYYNDEISEEQYNSIMFGNGDHPWAAKNGCHSLTKIVDILSSIGIKILSHRCNHGEFFIVGERQ